MSTLRVVTDVLHSTLLAQHQAVQEKLRQDCLNLPSFKNGDLPTPREIKGMDYLGNVLREGE